MKIGIFGDSYADYGSDDVSHAWPCIIKKELQTDIKCYAQAGSSLYYSYQLFLEHYQKFDTIIFVITSSNRWPNLPKNLKGRNWNIGFSNIDPLLNQLNPYFFTLFPYKLLNIIHSAIHKDIVERCINENKFLFQIVPFIHYNAKARFDFEYYENSFPLISGLDEISHREEMFQNGKTIKIAKFLTQQKCFDFRACHLNKANNKILAELIIDSITNKKQIDIRGDSVENLWILNDGIDANQVTIRATNEKNTNYR